MNAARRKALAACIEKLQPLFAQLEPLGKAVGEIDRLANEEFGKSNRTSSAAGFLHAAERHARLAHTEMCKLRDFLNRAKEK